MIILKSSNVNIRDALKDGVNFDLVDTDTLNIGSGDVASGTALAAIIAKNKIGNFEGVASSVDILSVKTEFEYTKNTIISDSNQGGVNQNRNFILQDNTGELILDALQYAKSQSQVILLNNHHSSVDTEHQHNYGFEQGEDSILDLYESQVRDVYLNNFNNDCATRGARRAVRGGNQGQCTSGGFNYNFTGSTRNIGPAGSSVESGPYFRPNLNSNRFSTEETRDFSDSAISADTENNIYNALNDTNNIFVTSVANSFYSELVSSGRIRSDSDSDSDSDGNQYKTLIAVADVRVDSIEYCNNNIDGNCKADFGSDLNGDGDFDDAESATFTDGQWEEFVDTDGFDQNGVSKIANIDIRSFKDDGNDQTKNSCEGLSSARCVIAPSNNYSFDANGTLVAGNPGSLDGDYTGAAYVAGIISSLRGAYTEEELSNENIIKKIIETAIDPSFIDGCVDADGTNNGRCGAGMVNFYEIVKAQNSGSATVATASSSSFSLENTSITLSSAFGDAFTANSASILSQAVSFDDYNFSYNAGLENSVRRASNISKVAMGAFIEEPQETIVTDTISLNNASFNITHTKENNKLDKYFKTSFDADNKEKVDFTNLAFNGSYKKLDYKFYFNEAREDDTHNNIAKSSQHFGPAKKSNSLSLQANLTNNIVARNNSILNSEKMSNISSLEFSGKAANKLTLSYGQIREDDGFLGVKSTGAFGENHNSLTQHMNFNFSTKVKSFAVKAYFAVALTDVNLDRDSLISDIDSLKTQEMSIDISKKTKLGNLSLSYKEPLRVTDGTANITVNSGKSYGENVFASEAVSLTPFGKERNYEFALDKKLKNNDNLQLKFIFAHDEANIKGNDNMGIAIKFSKRF